MSKSKIVDTYRIVEKNTNRILVDGLTSFNEDELYYILNNFGNVGSDYEVYQIPSVVGCGVKIMNGLLW